MKTNLFFKKRMVVLSYIFSNQSFFPLLKLILISLTIIIIISNYLLYRYQLNKWLVSSHHTAAQIEEFLTRTFKQTEQFMIYIGKRIARDNYTDPTAILES